MPITKKAINTSKKATSSAKKGAPTSAGSQKRIVVKKSKTSKSLFSKKVEKANELLRNAQLITRVAVTTR